MANPEQLAILKQGVAVWNAWRKEHPELESRIDLSGTDLFQADLSAADLFFASLSHADLRRANLYSVNLSNANLSSANLHHANLSRADLSSANLSSAYLRRANLSSANLSSAYLSHANLSGADLSTANISGASLSDTNLSGATLNRTTMVTVDLRSAKGLESIKHQGPSSIDIDSLVRSQGNIPDIFLRGAGIPEPFITNMRSLISAMDPIQFYSCFISYSTQDQDFADRLHADLQAEGVRCWFAPHDVQGGRKLHEQIDEAIPLHDKLLLILSPHSMESEWVKTEISKARKREVRDKARVLFPISLAPFEVIRDWEAFDADTGKDSAREIREYFIPDFSQWKDHDSYQKGFERLMRDLQATPQASAHTQR